MKQLLILSGKGGTGKTTISSSFIYLNQPNQVADCDVEAPNLHLMMKLDLKTSKAYHGLKKAKIIEDKCIGCGLCYEHCRFNAIENINKYVVNSYKCEGCKVCQIVCPSGAIDFVETVDGSINLYGDQPLFSTARLKMGSGNSGLLVSEVKRLLDLNDDQLTIIDGPPGIGCPVIASMSGVDFILLVTEPSMSGLSDLKRIIETIEKTRIKKAVCINKYDINTKISQKIIDYLYDKNIDYLGHIQYDSSVSDLINQGINIVEKESTVSKQIKDIYLKVHLLMTSK